MRRLRSWRGRVRSERSALKPNKGGGQSLRGGGKTQFAHRGGEDRVCLVLCPGEVEENTVLATGLGAEEEEFGAEGVVADADLSEAEHRVR